MNAQFEVCQDGTFVSGRGWVVSTHSTQSVNIFAAHTSGTLAVSPGPGHNFSSELRIDYVNLASIAIGRRPYITESSGQLVFRTDTSLAGSHVAVSASLPSVPGKTWHWPDGDCLSLVPTSWSFI